MCRFSDHGGHRVPRPRHRLRALREHLSDLAFRPVKYLILGFFLMGLTGCSGTSSDPDSSTSTPTNEQAWIIQTIATDLARLAAFAGKATLAESEKIAVHRIGDEALGKYRITLPGADGEALSAEIVVTTHALDPSTYAPLADILRTSYELTSDDTEFEPEVIQKLTTLTASNVRFANDRVSNFLTDHPASVAGNDEAAFLLGVFALRENSGMFWNPLPASTRATAHLAFSNSLRGTTPPSVEADLAEIFIGLVIDTKADTAARIAALEKRADTAPETAPWLRAASLRNSRDWRGAPGGQSENTLVEQIEMFRALGDAADSGVAVAYLQKFSPPNVADWGRIILGLNFSVGEGHMFTNHALQNEIEDACRLLGRSKPEDEATFTAFLAELNTAPSPIVTLSDDGTPARLRVLDRGLICRYAQRHICHVLLKTWDFLAFRYGVPEQAAAYWQQIEQTFSGLDSFPVLAFYKACDREEAAPYAEPLARMMQRSPETVPDLAWFKADSPDYAALFPDISHQVTAWFSPWILPGTGHCLPTRLRTMRDADAASPEELERLYAIAPLQSSLVIQRMQQLSRPQRTPPMIQEIAGDLLEYHLPIIDSATRILDARDSEMQETLLTRAAQIDPDRNYQLAQFLVAQNRLDEAAETYQAMVNLASDRVAVANRVQWLVEYYFQVGQIDEARAVAAMAGEVYSHQGIETYSWFLEQNGEYDAAEAELLKLVERYDSPAELSRFYARRAIADPDSSYAEKLRAQEAAIFPNGRHQVVLSDFAGEPTRGIGFAGNSDIMRQNGLAPTDIVVAVDGWRVENEQQYLFARDLETGPQFSLIIYRDGKYQEMPVTADQRRLRVHLRNFSR